MTTYYSSLYATSGIPLSLVAPTTPFSYRAFFSFTVGTAFLVNDRVYCAPIPTGYKLTGWAVEFPALDDNGSTSVDVGDSTTITRFVSDSVRGWYAAVPTILCHLSGLTSLAVSDTFIEQPHALPVSYTTDSTTRSPVSAGVGGDLIVKIRTASTGVAAATGIISGYAEYQAL